MGNIIPGEKKKKKFDLNLICDNEIPVASWKYENISYKGVNNTNLKNVFLSVRNNTDTIRNSGQSYTDVSELNDLSVEINANSNAEAGKLNVPLLFTLTYS
ncbi:hypothetical protein C0W59_21555 [Photobacterium kishitanii]|uniref:hypothetical protein n=1 Tax=Photobacterium kishitanii TaxID=318456 RepID=UPI000D1715F9|nr:hypothetical protein [Photobacterium kishitanii]PSV09996.1 hypothetical protein C0W59_21555 [Photobacterium kishitanii]